MNEAFFKNAYKTTSIRKVIGNNTTIIKLQQKVASTSWIWFKGRRKHKPFPKPLNQKQLKIKPFNRRPNEKIEFQKSRQYFHSKIGITVRTISRIAATDISNLHQNLNSATVDDLKVAYWSLLLEWADTILTFLMYRSSAHIRTHTLSRSSGSISWS